MNKNNYSTTARSAFMTGSSRQTMTKAMGIESLTNQFKLTGGKKSKCHQYFFLKQASYTTRTNLSSSPNSKVVTNIKPILKKHLFPGASVNIGGFGLGGIPETLLHELEHYDEAKDLTIASLTAGIDGFGLGKLFEVEGKVKRVLASYVGENKVSWRCIYRLNGNLERKAT